MSDKIPTFEWNSEESRKKEFHIFKAALQAHLATHQCRFVLSENAIRINTPLDPGLEPNGVADLRKWRKLQQTFWVEQKKLCLFISDLIRLPVCIGFINQNRCCPYIRHTGKIWPYFPYVVCERLTGKNDLGRMYDIRANFGRMSVCPCAFRLLCWLYELRVVRTKSSHVTSANDKRYVLCFLCDSRSLSPFSPVRLSCCILCILYLYRILHL